MKIILGPGRKKSGHGQRPNYAKLCSSITPNASLVQTTLSTQLPGIRNEISTRRYNCQTVEEENKLQKQLETKTLYKEQLQSYGVCFPTNLHQNYEFQFDQFARKRTIGSGNFGQVIAVHHKPSGEFCAMKRIRSNFMQDPQTRKNLLAELGMVVKSRDNLHHRMLEAQRCRNPNLFSPPESGTGSSRSSSSRASRMSERDQIYHENIVQFYGAGFIEGDCCIIMELMDRSLGDLKNYVFGQLKTTIPEQVLKRILLCIVRALQYLKDVLKIIHRDVKPSNMLFNRAGQVKLCDFGISGRLIDSVALTRSIGCQSYMAPERINPDNAGQAYDIRADVWSLGLSLYELATGRFPYQIHDLFTLISKIIEGDAPSLQRTIQQQQTKNMPGEPRLCYSTSFIQVIDYMITKDVNRRPTYNLLLDSRVLRATAKKEGMTGAEDTRRYFNAVIEEIYQSRSIQSRSPR